MKSANNEEAREGEFEIKEILCSYIETEIKKRHVRTLLKGTMILI